jgi:predicted enzyme related to lactoylglutathione lyase
MAAGVAAVWLPVDDMDRAVGFYRDVLGLSVQEQQEQWSALDANGLLVGLNAREESSHPQDSGGAVISFQPDGDIEAEVSRLTDAGVEFHGPIADQPWGRIAAFADTEGNSLQLYAPPA